MATLRKTAARGYGSSHQRLRKRWAILIARGGVVCWRCGRAILPGMLFDLGHNDWDRTRYAGPEHRYCNRAAGARKKQVMINKPTKINKIVDRW